MNSDTICQTISLQFFCFGIAVKWKFTFPPPITSLTIITQLFFLRKSLNCYKSARRVRVGVLTSAFGGFRQRLSNRKLFI